MVHKSAEACGRKPDSAARRADRTSARGRFPCRSPRTWAYREKPCYYLLFHVIAPEHVLLAQIEFSVDDHRVRPARAFDVLNLERAGLLVSGWRCFHEGDDAVLIAAIEMA